MKVYRTSMNTSLRKFLSILLVLFSGCSSMKIEDFKDKVPVFNFEEVLLGDSVGQGLFFDRFGKLQSQFTVQLKGRKEADTFFLDEHLTYATGEKTQRTFTFKKIADGEYIGEAQSFVGPIKVKTKGNAAQWRYVLLQDTGSGSYQFTFDDWMFLMPDQTILNRATMYKFGIRLGEVVMSVRKVTSSEK